MATAVHIPVSEYLATNYRPDCDYVDGEVRERNLGTRPHAALQGILAAIFHANRKSWGIVSLPEQRVQIARTRFRIPDICVLSATDRADPVVHIAPMICIEVLSPDDTLSDMQERAEDYDAMGVGYIWIFDPVRHRVWRATSSGLQKESEHELSVEGTSIHISLDEVFAELDELTQTVR